MTVATKYDVFINSLYISIYNKKICLTLRARYTIPYTYIYHIYAHKVISKHNTINHISFYRDRPTDILSSCVTFSLVTGRQIFYPHALLFSLVTGRQIFYPHALLFSRDRPTDILSSYVSFSLVTGRQIFYPHALLFLSLPADRYFILMRYFYLVTGRQIFYPHAFLFLS
jgi:hypothetical protein